MTESVIDASVVLRWGFVDERDREGAVRVAAALAEDQLRAIGPPTFFPEVAGVLVRAIRAGRIPRDTADSVMAALIKVAIDEAEPHGLAFDAMRLALQSGLRVQDAMYVALARARGATLISADQRQLDAAASLGVACVSLTELPPPL